MEKAETNLIHKSETIDQRIDRINQITEQVKSGFFLIASNMKAIKDDMVDQGKNNNDFLNLIEERTGYKKASVYRFLRAHEAIVNLKKNCAHVGTFPDEEAVIRALATKTLNEDPKLQARIWEEVVEQASGKKISAQMVRKSVYANTKETKEWKRSESESTFENGPEMGNDQMSLLKEENKRLKLKNKKLEAERDELKDANEFLRSELMKYIRKSKDYAEREKNINQREQELYKIADRLKKQREDIEKKGMKIFYINNPMSKIQSHPMFRDILKSGIRGLRHRYHPDHNQNSDKQGLYHEKIIEINAFKEVCEKSGIQL